MSQREIAEQLSVHPATIMHFESGHRVPRDDIRQQIAEFVAKWEEDRQRPLNDMMPEGRDVELVLLDSARSVMQEIAKLGDTDPVDRERLAACVARAKGFLKICETMS
jgi:transcriptional regulator with XRE-family HTH domain